MKYTYLLLNLLTILVPLIMSFEKKIFFRQHWKHVFISISIVGALFLIWDVIFTGLGVWEFNSDYIIGIYFLDLPLEEWLFFVTVPFACVFIYEVLSIVKFSDFANQFSRVLLIILSATLLIIAILNTEKLYTTSTFFLLALILVYYVLVSKAKSPARFISGYLLALIPFFIINGLLTGFPVVIYNNEENLGIRLFTIPLEDIFYGMLLVLGNIMIFDRLKN